MWTHTNQIVKFTVNYILLLVLNIGLTLIVILLGSVQADARSFSERMFVILASFFLIIIGYCAVV